MRDGLDIVSFLRIAIFDVLNAKYMIQCCKVLMTWNANVSGFESYSNWQRKMAKHVWKTVSYF